MDYKKLFYKIPETMVVLSPDFVVLDATDDYLKVTMRSREDLIGKDFLEAFPDNPDDEGSRNTKTLRNSLTNVLQNKEVDYFPVTRYDIPRPAAAGGGFDVRYWEASHTPVLGENGEVELIIQRTSDVTERELAKQALSESESKFRFMAEAMPMLLSTSNAHGNPDYFNQSWVKYTGLTVQQLFSNHWSEVIHPEDIPLMRSRWKDVLQKGAELQAEVRIKDKSGVYRWHITRSAPMRGEDGEVVMWVTSSVDIHDTRMMVQELLEANEQASLLSDQVQLAYQKVVAEQKSLENIIMQAPAIFCTLKGPEHRFELVNPHYQALFPGKQLVGRSVAEALPEVVEQGLVQVLDNVYATGVPFVAEERRVELDRFGTGELQEVYLNFSYQPIYNAQGEISGIFVFAYNVGEQVRLRTKLQELGHA